MPGMPKKKAKRPRPRPARVPRAAPSPSVASSSPAPSTEPAAGKDHVLFIRVTRAEHDAVRRASKKAGSPSDAAWVRKIVQAALQDLDTASASG